MIPSTAGEPVTRTAISQWEEAYNHAWHRFWHDIVEIVNRLQREDTSTEYRQATIQRLVELTTQVDNIENTGKAMFEHDTGCYTVRQHSLAYFAREFTIDCHRLHFTLNMLTWELINHPQSNQMVRDRLCRLLEDTRSTIPNS